MLKQLQFWYFLLSVNMIVLIFSAAVGFTDSAIFSGIGAASSILVIGAISKLNDQ
jgi:hypothetical protein